MNSMSQHIEALLFTAGEPVSFQDLAKLLNAKEDAIAQSLAEIKQALDSHGISLLLTNTHAQLVTSASVAEFLTQFAGQDGEDLSRAAMETLAVIAYRGPISRYDIDAIRGVDSRRMIRQLLLRGLLQQTRTAGQASLYDVSEDALMKLGVTSKQELPEFELLSTEENLERLLDKEQ